MKDEEIVKILQDDSVPQNEKDCLFRQIIEKYENELYKTVYNYIFSKGTKEDAEDIVVETFARFYKNIKSFKLQTSVKNYLYRIAINLSINFLKSKKIDFVSFEEIKEQLEDKTSIDGELIKEETQKELKEIISKLFHKLPDKQRTVLYLVTYKKMSYKEIAEVLNTTVSSVESLIFRAKQNLKKFVLKNKNLKERLGL
jgi:RNA polymerase sigma-70 factor (ECF subfamily)